MSASNCSSNVSIVDRLEKSTEAAWNVQALLVALHARIEVMVSNGDLSESCDDAELQIDGANSLTRPMRFVVREVAAAAIELADIVDCLRVLEARQAGGAT